MRIRKPALMAAILISASLIMTGCGGKDNAAADEAQDNAEQDTQAAIDSPLTVSGTAGDGRNINFIRTPYVDTDAADANGDNMSVTPVTPDPAFSSPSPIDDDLKEAAPSFFDVEDAVEPVMGYSDDANCDALIDALNVERKNFQTGTLKKNYSLCVAADVRGREYAIYPVYKLRPDDRPFTTISPDGYVKDEYFCTPVRNNIAVAPFNSPKTGTYAPGVPAYPYNGVTPTLIVEGLLEIREARNIMLNPDYTQVGATWFINGNYVIAGFTFSY